MLSEKFKDYMKKQSLSINNFGRIVYEPEVGGKYEFSARVSADPTDEEVQSAMQIELTCLVQASALHFLKEKRRWE